MDRNKILFLIDSLGHGGAEKLLTLYLKYLDKEKFSARVCVFADRGGNPLAVEIEKLDIQVDLLPVNKLRDLSALPRLVTYIKDKNFDILHTQLSFANTLGSIASSLAGVPSLSTLHTLKNPSKGTSSFWRFQLMGFCLRLFSDRIISVSEATRIYNNEKLKLPEKKTLTLFNGIEIDKFQTLNDRKKAIFKQELRIPESSKVVTTVAVLRKEKGLQYMIEAMPEIIHEVPDVTYLIVGDGEYRSELETVSAETGVSDRVKFVGYQEDVSNFLSISDLFVLPSLTEALPTVLAEAMVVGVPIIASEVGGIPEMIRHNHNGILVPPKNVNMLAQATLRLLTKDILLAEMCAENGKKFVYEKFNITTQIKMLEEIYLKLLSERK